MKFAGLPASPAAARSAWIFDGCLAIVVATFVSCGGGDTPAVAPADKFRVSEMRVNIDGAPYGVYKDFTQPILLDDEQIVVAKTRLSFELILDAPSPATTCTIGEATMKLNPSGALGADIQVAYLSETLELTCLSQESVPVRAAVTVTARDPQLESALDYYFNKMIPKKNDRVPSDPYSGYRMNSYYSEMPRLILVAEAYAKPEFFHMDRDGQLRRTLESYLINTSEAYFEPCVDYDFETGPPSQCRSPERIGKYYRWRSPLIADPIAGSTHAMAEWRAGGGIAQAIEALLAEHADDDRQRCPTSDNPSEMMDSSLICRALNVRRLLYEEVWKKWSDEEWVASLGYSYQSTIQGSDVSHWIARTELMVDLFQSTAHMSGDADCSECDLLASVPSRLDDLLGFFFEFGDGHVGVSCRPPHMLTGCDFLGDDLQTAGVSDLSHVSEVIHLVSMYGQETVCTSDKRKCIVVDHLARTMNDLAWVDWIPNEGAAGGFPKFDVFFNGHCSRAAFDDANPLKDFCTSNWLPEAGPHPLHKNLFGLVNLGRHSRDLMIRLREAADENHDGLLNRDDGNLNLFAVRLYWSEADKDH